LVVQAVRETALAPLPRGIWPSGEPVKVLMRSDHPEAWATLVSAPDWFFRVHDAARLVRQLGGVQTGYPVPPKRATCGW